MARRNNDSGATVGYEAELWEMANTLRGSMDAAEYKHVVLGLIFLKYISDAFEERHAAILAEWGEDAAEDRDEYLAENIFWVPPEARWEKFRAGARQPEIGQLVDNAMSGIERDNSALKDVLPKDYARQALDKQRLGQLVDLVSNIRVGDAESRSRDVLGRVYRYFLSQFASAEGKKGGEFYTPRCVVKLLVEMIRAVSRPRVRPVLRLLRHVRAVDRVHQCPRQWQWQRRQGARRHQHLRSGIESYDLAARQNEPRYPGHRGTDRTWRYVPQRPPSGPKGRLHPG